jgi:hypothetical protein
VIAFAAGFPVYIAVTHSGVTMSPFLGAAVADEIVAWTAKSRARRFPACAFLQLTWRRIPVRSAMRDAAISGIAHPYRERQPRA